MTNVRHHSAQSFPRPKFSLYTFIILFLASIIGLLAFHRLKSAPPVYAGCVINMSNWSTSAVQSCLYQGGTIGLVGTYGSYGAQYKQTADIIRAYNQTVSNPTQRVGLEFRGYIANDSRPPTPDEINATIAMMQQNQTGGPLIYRPLNEPTSGYSMPGYDKIKAIAEAQYAARQAINNSGGGIYLASEMLDLWQGDPRKVWAAVDAYIKANPGNFPGVNSYHDLYDIYSINGYFNPGSFGVYGNGVTLQTVLDEVMNQGKRWRFSEFGVIHDGALRPTYDKSEIKNTLLELVVWLKGSGAAYVGSFAGLGVFTTDPHSTQNSQIAAIINEIFQEDPSLKGLFSMFSAGYNNPEEFDYWIGQLLKDGLLVTCCLNGVDDCAGDPINLVGYAPSKEQCTTQFAVGDNNPNQCTIGTKSPDEEKGILRPAPCQNCSYNVEDPTRACADITNVRQRVTYTCGDIEECNGDIVRKDMDVSLKITTEETKVPFAGYHDILREESEATGDEMTPNLNNYLADYIAGTALYDGRPFDGLNEKDRRDLLLQAGVYRKLAPMEIQDKYRKDMILKGFDYEITDGTTTKTMQEWAAQPFPFNGSAGRFPPDKDDKLYDVLLEDWLKTTWGKLWYRIPLFSREDSPGKAVVTIEHDPGTVTPQGVGQGGGASASFPLAVPHVARLYESSKALNELLMPYMKDNQGSLPQKTEIASAPTPKPAVLLANASLASDESFQKPAVLAQAASEGFHITADASYTEPNVYVRVTFIADGEPGCDGDVELYKDGARIAGLNGWNNNGGQGTYTYEGQWTGSPITVGRGQSVTVSYMGRIGRGPRSCTGMTSSISCTFTVTGSGEFINSCGGSAPPVVNQCENRHNIGTCSSNEPVYDPNPNLDHICCNISAQLQAVSYIIPADREAVCKPTECERFLLDDNGDYILDDAGNPQCIIRGQGGTAEGNIDRKLQVDFQVPHLNSIYELSNADWGFFNIFRPDGFDPLPDNDALSQIKYEVSGANAGISSGQPGEDSVGDSSLQGNLYFPYLGGVQDAKKCISEQFLVPHDLQSPNNYCYFWGGTQPGQPPLNQDDLYIRGDILNKMDCTNSGFKISEDAKKSVIATAERSWPEHLLDNEKIWNDVVKQSSDNGWNPACVIALWIEESGGSGLVPDPAKYSLGCTMPEEPDPVKNLYNSLGCFFSRHSQPAYSKYTKGSREWWLVYAGGQNNNGTFINHPNFVRNLYHYYYRLTQ